MKKLAFVFLFLLAPKVEARNFEIWRSTIIRGAWTNVQITTYPAYLYKIEVPTAAPGSTIQFFGGGTIDNKTSSGPIYDISNTQNFYYPLRPYTSGYMFTSVGNSTSTLYWEYLFRTPESEKSNGLTGE